MFRGLTTGDHEIRRQHLGKHPDNLEVLPMPDVIVSMFGNPTAAFILFWELSFPFGRPPAVLCAPTQVTTTQFTLAQGN